MVGLVSIYHCQSLDAYQTMLWTLAKHLTLHADHWCNSQVIYRLIKVLIAAVFWTVFSFSRSVGILCLCSNLELSAECLTCWAEHLPLLTRSSLSLPPTLFSFLYLLSPSSFILLSLVCYATPNLCFRPLQLAPGNLNKSSFSVFCCKYSHYRHSLPCMLASHFTLVMACTEARTDLLQEHAREIMSSSLSPRLTRPSPVTSTSWFSPSCHPSKSWAALVYLY